MLLHDSRRAARLRDGELVLLADQDRTLWNQRADRRRAAPRSTARLRCCGRDGGPYVLQAAIASLHAEDAPRLAADRRALRGARALTRSPVVELNRAVASPKPKAGGRVARARGARARRLPLPARGSRRPPAPAGAADEARVAYERALELAHSEPERRFLERRLAELEA